MLLRISALIMAVACACAVAEEGPAPAKPNAEAKPVVPKKPPLKRRSVQQVIERMPPAPVTNVYRPTLNPAPPPVLSAPAPGPVPVNRCDAGGCNDVNGVRYNSGVGNASVNSQGKLCTQNGAWLQCF